MDVMCSTCGIEVTARSAEEARRKHDDFDPAHEPMWYEDGDADRPVW